MEGPREKETRKGGVLSAAAASGPLRDAEALVAAFEVREVSAYPLEGLRHSKPLFGKVYSDPYVELVTDQPDLLGLYLPATCITEPQRGRFKGLVKRVLLRDER